MATGLEIRLENNVDKLRRDNGTFLDNVDRIEENMSKEFAEELEDLIKESVDKTFDQSTSTGNLKENVEARKDSGRGGRYTVSANAYNDGVNYAAWHEFAENSHFVPYVSKEGEERTSLIRWAKQKGIFSSTWGVTVTPHSFMEEPVREAIARERKRARSGRNALNKALGKAFRR